MSLHNLNPFEQEQLVDSIKRFLTVSDVIDACFEVTETSLLPKQGSHTVKFLKSQLDRKKQLHDTISRLLQKASTQKQTTVCNCGAHSYTESSCVRGVVEEKFCQCQQRVAEVSIVR